MKQGILPCLAAGLLLVGMFALTEPAGGEPVAACTDYATGADHHTTCQPSAGAPPGSAIICHNYTVGGDTHAECAPAPQPRSILPRRAGAVPLPPAQPLRCSTYHIGASAYTECR